MNIEELVRDLNVTRVRGLLGEDIKGIAYDSRVAKKGDLFVAIKGFSADGHTYIGDAINRGCVGVVIEKSRKLYDSIHSCVPNNTAVVEVESSREALALLSAAYYGEPSKELSLIGITGTNGKTTTTYIVRSILETWDKTVGLLGTIHYVIGEKTLTAPHTTPESLDLQKYLREMVENGVEYAVLEISSHALTLGRVGGCSLKVAAFTNFSQDHLDFHGTMDEYFQAKRKIFEYLDHDGFAVLNRDDPRVNNLQKDLNFKVITCGLEKGADFRALNITDNVEGNGLSFEIQTPDGSYTLRSGLTGMTGIYNILMSAGIAYVLGVKKEVIQEGIQKTRTVEGRFEKVDEEQDFQCIVDYAHTEDALRNLIREARRITKGKIITVFGCGGDRDRAKRPRMGSVTAELSDFIIITSDNPRTEEPMDIISEIRDGIQGKNYSVQPDRGIAIEEAVSMAEKGDTVLIAGKGHEDYQEIQGIRYPFSDKEVVKKIIRKRKGFKDSRNQGF
jgi:UDP-N-acetylmuramoyl-L-alanyl-D-glutamate--2,6-diaminopimelate ligase